MKGPRFTAVGRAGEVSLIVAKKDAISKSDGVLAFGRCGFGDARVKPGLAEILGIKDVAIVADDDESPALEVSESADEVMGFSVLKDRFKRPF